MSLEENKEYWKELTLAMKERSIMLEESNEALKKLLEVYRKYVDFPTSHGGLTLKDIGDAERKYEQETKSK